VDATCRYCQTPNRAGAKFCRQCGQLLPATPLPTQRTMGGWPLWLPIAGGGLLLFLLLIVVSWRLLSSDPTATPGATETAVSAATIDPAVPTATLDPAVPTATLDPAATIAPTVETVPPTAGPTPTLGPLTVPGTDIEVPRLTDEEEIEIGREVAADVEREFGVYEDAAALERVRTIGLAIVPHSDRPHLPYQFTLLDSDDINAFAVPGGFIYVTRGMLDFVGSDDELAGVLGHEIAHVGRRHGAERIEAFALVRATAEALLDDNPDLEDIYDSERGQLAAEMTALILFNGWSRQQELESDEYGTIYMAHAGYDPQGMITLFQRMQAEGDPADAGRVEWLLASHPPFDERIRRVEETIIENNL
jgi:predicted Zn-dependent protease